MGAILTDVGEEFMMKYVFTDGVTRPATVTVGLYNDATDLIEDTDGLSAITTEPVGASYARQPVNIPGDFIATKVGGNWQVVLADTTFDSSDSSASVDSVFVAITFDSEDKGDAGTPADHLMFTGALDATYDLSGLDQFTATGVGLNIT